MALDHALMDRARQTGEGVLRVYGWSSPVLSLGRNQTARNVYDTDAMARRGIAIVRRPTGGRALLHFREITYSVTRPFESGQSLTATYADINAVLLGAIRSLGVDARVAERRSPAMPPGSRPCFAEPAVGEIVVGERKLAGSAQWGDAGALLQHGSVLIDDDQSSIPSLMLQPTPLPPKPATLRDAFSRGIHFGTVADALLTSLRELTGEAVSAMRDSELRDLPSASLLAHYASPGWTWRR